MNVSPLRDVSSAAAFVGASRRTCRAGQRKDFMSKWVTGIFLTIVAVAARADDTWPFNPPEDKFAPDCLLDLRPMNEQTAGEHGVITLSPDGMSFVRGDGQPIRFWAANAL